ncbi:hypothetical protein KSP39_PZI016854 [Platanthera zijinensis]|uniref:AB hydrolase-1 domain-containing protein n=1 Tax=Platanthera zijinensis TaxID=2320716 RepID=A0AAP0B6G0_9ASPA
MEKTSKKHHLDLLLYHLRRLLSPITLKELALSLLLLLCGLYPLTLTFSGGATKIHLWGPRRQRPDRPALVLIHGFGGFSKWQFERQIAPLSRRFDLYLPDLLFFGGSATADENRSVEFQARCVAEAMRKLGVERYSVAGVSYGGFVAFRMAASAAEKAVERVVIITAGIAATATERRKMTAREGRDVAERRGRPALLLIHGYGGFAKWQFERQIVPLSRCFDLYLPDLVFFGGSETADGNRTVDFQAECVAEAMRRVGVERYSVVGMSYGGYVAFRMAAAAAAGEVERVVIMAAGIAAPAEERGMKAAGDGMDLVDLLLPEKADDLRKLFRRCMHRPPWMPDFLLRDFIEIMFKDHRNERIELLKELLTNGVGWDPLPLLKQETLILWGDKDIVFPLPLAYALKRHLGGKARLQVIEKAGHALQIEKPLLVNNLIKRFILQDVV